MIVRILGEGQFDVPDSEVGALQVVDESLQHAVDLRDEEAFTRSLGALLKRVRTLGTPLPPDSLESSTLVLPPADSTVAEVEHLLSGEGLIPD